TMPNEATIARWAARAPVTSSNQTNGRITPAGSGPADRTSRRDPAGEAAREIPNPIEPPGAEHAGGDRRAAPTLTMDHDLPVPGHLVEPPEQLRERDQGRTGDVPGAPFGPVPDVEHERLGPAAIEVGRGGL